MEDLRLAVAYICDANYHALTACSIASLALSHQAPLDIFLFQDGYDAPVSEQLSTFVESRGHSLTLRPAPRSNHADSSARARGARDYVTDTALLKPRIVDLLAETYDYVAYLDSDFLVFSDLELQRLLGFSELCAGCLDFPMASGAEDPAFFDNCERNNLSKNYINSGFYIINCAKWKTVDFMGRYRANVDNHNERCSYLTICVLRDQCPFNMTLQNDILLLPIEYNMQRWALYTQAWRTAKARHYTGARKFLDPRLHKTDRRERTLMRLLKRQAGVRAKRIVYDFGLSYAANSLRRRKDISNREAALDRLRSVTLAR